MPHPIYSYYENLDKWIIGKKLVSKFSVFRWVSGGIFASIRYHLNKKLLETVGIDSCIAPLNFVARFSSNLPHR